MPKIDQPTYASLKASWSSCERCELCARRKRVVLLKGSLPASVLIVGEAPGDSEDVSGIPFHGPAGKLLEQQLVAAGFDPDPKAGQLAFTNVIGCIPKNELNEKLNDPPKYAIEACEDRLVKTIQLVAPRAVIYVGKVAEKQGPLALVKALPNWTDVGDVIQRAIIHPAAILRMNIAQQGLAHQRCIAVLTDVLEGVGL